jgi:spermidine synthase
VEPAWVVPALAVAFLLSGSAGLVHEVVWVRLLGLVFGATSLAISTVLATFMGGLAIGSYWVGRRTARLADHRRVYALLEIAIGVYALLVPVILHAVEPLYGWLWRQFHLSFAVFSVIRFLVAGTVILVPTIMMGATFPILADYLAGLRGRSLAPQWLYTMNLAGAVLGAAAAGYFLMPVVGVRGTIAIGAALNVAVGVAVLWLPRVASPHPRDPIGDDPAGGAGAAALPRPGRLLLAAAFLSGLVSLATQVAWTRVLSLIVGSTTYAFASVLVVYLVALGLGSALASRRGGRVRRVEPDLAIMQAALAVCMLGAVYCVNRLPYWYLQLYAAWSPDSIAGVVAMKSLIIWIVLFLPVLCAGTILPLVLVGALPLQSRGTGAVVGEVYAVNTVGAIVGSVLSGFVLIPVLGSQSTLLGVCGVAIATALAFAFSRGTPSWVRGVVVVAAAVVAVGATRRPDWNHLELHAGVFEPGRIVGTVTETLTEEGERTLFHREGPTASVVVVKRPSGAHVLIVNARANASDTAADMGTQVLLAQVPLLLAPRTDEVFIVGWGSGVTVGSATVAPIHRVTAVELEPAVVEASEWFLHVNGDPLRHPSVRVFEDDARHILLASRDMYDVIISEPSQPWSAGVANVFTQDFYRLAERRLAPDGVFAQWVQLYQISFDVFLSVVATFQSVFPEVLVFKPLNGLDVILIGSRNPLPIDLEQLHERWRAGSTAADLARVGIGQPEHLLANFFLSPDTVRRLVKGVPINTDDNMYVEARAPLEMARRMGESSAVKIGVLERLAPPPEDLLADPAALLDHPQRMEALVEGLRLADRDPARYETEGQDR